MNQEKHSAKAQESLDEGTYEIIRKRLNTHRSELQQRLHTLNESRKNVFGSLETELLANNRISTENNCIARDIVSLANTCIFGYNVHFGLRTEIELSDVFSVYTFENNSFSPSSIALLEDETFLTDFSNLYKYYRNTIFVKFARIGNFLHMVFQLSERESDIKTFKWLVKDNTLTYVDNRSEHEYTTPDQHQFRWQEATRDMQRYGEHPHISILDKVFVETIGGDLTIKIEDNTDDGKGIYNEPVDYHDQTLDDGEVKYADLGNLIVIEIKPFQEDSRFFVYNHKMQEVQRIDSIKDTAVLLPDNQGIIFPNGYYLQTGEYHVVENQLSSLKFQEVISSPNGEDYLYVFYSQTEGTQVLMDYNVIDQKIKTPIVCGGFTILPQGQLCYFKADEEQTKHHMIQIWQTPYLEGEIMPSEHQDTMLYKIGNKEIVKAMAESQELITLLQKEDNYDGLYTDIARATKNIIDSYHWLKSEEAGFLFAPLEELNTAANAAVDEFQKVLHLKRNANKATTAIQQKTDTLLSAVKSTSFKTIDEFVEILSSLRRLRGEVIGLKEVRYTDPDQIAAFETALAEQNELISRRCVEFLLKDTALEPYHNKVDEKSEQLTSLKKVVDVKALESDVNTITTELEMLIDIVTNLHIEDTSQSADIIDNVSLIFAKINQLKAAIKARVKDLGSKEARADFTAQIKLIDQSVINYIDMATTADQCDDFQNKVSVQLEELEGKFAEFDEYLEQLTEKREEIYNVFDNRKNAIKEKRNKRVIALINASERILKGVSNKAQTFKSANDINGYFASDLMVEKLRDIVKQLRELDDSGNAEKIATALKTSKEDALRKLKDKLELYEDGDHVIKLGPFRFGVNNQGVDLSIVFKNKHLYYHLGGTDFYQKLNDPVLERSIEFWEQDLVSENETVYRSSYLAYKIYKKLSSADIAKHDKEQLTSLVREESRKNFSEGYVKGVHDEDAVKILEVLIQKHLNLGLLRFAPSVRAYAQFFWHDLSKESRHYFNHAIKASGAVLEIFPATRECDHLLQELETALIAFGEHTKLYLPHQAKDMSLYLFKELQGDDEFEVSGMANKIAEEFQQMLKREKAVTSFENSLKQLPTISAKIRLVRQWLHAFISNNQQAYDNNYLEEAAALLLLPHANANVNSSSAKAEIRELKGDHQNIQGGVLAFDFHEFTGRLAQFITHTVPGYLEYRKARHEAIERFKKQLRLDEFKPRVLSSFVRNKLIDQVYLPMIGENLSKQLGTVGENSRTDRMGMLLLISPPGYGKTTLMEYVANRLGLVFMKINGPSIGHEITSVDPEAANNSAAREELKKLNLAFEMGNNVMLYLDDIQHCNPEFLQKFISLADGTRRMEGVYNNQPKTYDFRGKKFCVIMAGNPYTESGEKFRIPDMLANRADIYNLGDIIGDTADLFRLSLLENAVTANPVLRQVANKSFKDIYTLTNVVEHNAEINDLEGNYTPQEINDFRAVLEKVMNIRETVLKVNETYIRSAGMEDAYRTEPAFKLQGSYRDMNKLVAKVVPIMNGEELNTLIRSHYENESQTLTSQAEANLLKFKELRGIMSAEERERWESIKENFKRINKLNGLGADNEMAQVVAQLMSFSENLEGIRNVLSIGLNHTVNGK
ncbi:DNA repair ATPase [Robertkochia sediminum]|uniref:DNA repair ATPase n=1 Tax=Robertkochia sediminum TaxID=2785326 RepID=UPI0019316CE9|nr:DNA repair ATPase [Robertkochia sediminum]MBL7471179.1 DNA repair ATPase [Robertkochia sediminum]